MPRDLERTVQAVWNVLARRLHRLAAWILPWSDRSQHDAWRAGYLEGARDASALRHPNI